MSVQCVVASPLSKGLLRGAIAQSGATLHRPTNPLIEAEKIGIQLSEKTEADIHQLRNLSADSLFALGGTLGYGAFRPIADGYVIPESMSEMFKKGKHNDVNLMAGWVTRDGDLLGGANRSVEEYQKYAEDTYGENKDEFLKAFPGADAESAKTSQTIHGFLQFAGISDHLWAKWNDSPAYLYHFSFVPTDKPDFPNYGAFHTSEVPFALKTLHMWDRPWKDRDYAVQEYMSSYWINFIKTGDPNGVNLPEWETYDPKKVNIMELGETPKIKEEEFKVQIDFLESLTDQ